MAKEVEVSGDRLMAVVTPLDAIIASGFRGGDFQPERGRYGNWTQKSTRTVMFATAEHERRASRPFPHRAGSWVSRAKNQITCAHYGYAARWTAVY